MWASRAALAITPENRSELERMVRSGKTEQRIALRARIVLGRRWLLRTTTEFFSLWKGFVLGC